MIKFSQVEFRPGGNRTPQHLGLVIEFTTSSWWVIGLAMRATFDFDSGLDRLTKDILIDRNKILEIEIVKALDEAKSPGDILCLLAKRNQWSLAVTHPIEAKINKKQVQDDLSIQSMLEKYIVSLYASPKDFLNHEKIYDPVTISRPHQNVRHELMPAWMNQSKHWTKPLLMV